MRPCLALPFTIVPSSDRVRLVAGEDFRYTLKAPALETWLPQWLPLFDGRRTLDDLLAVLPEQRRAAGRTLVESLYGERVLVEGPAAAACTPCGPGLHIEGSGILAADLRSRHGETPVSEVGLRVFCQDRLDYQAALHVNRRCRDEKTPWLWASCAPLSRGYVSPLFLPDAGPCLACLLASFQRLSPVPELYDDLLRHVHQGGAVQPTPAAAPVVGILRELVLGKAEWARQPEPAAALFRLHVVEAGTLEVSSQRVFVDPNCAVCQERR